MSGVGGVPVRRRPRTGPAVAVGALVVASVAVRLLVLRAPLTADEAGFSMVASQWRSGSSLYGGYWVDRPPGLLLLLALAHAGSVVDGVPAVRLLGMLAAAVTVVLAATLPAALTQARGGAGAGWRAVLPAAVVAVLASSFFLDVGEVDGELLALPAAVGGLVLLARAHRRLDAGDRWGWVLPAALAGGCGAAAASVKQDVVDVGVVVLVLAAVLALTGRRRRAGGLLLAWGAGAALVVGLLVLLAWQRGTSPAGLLDAVVRFRAEASSVIAHHSSGATDRRAHGLVAALVASGAPAMLLLLGRVPWRGRPATWSWAALALLGWEGFAVAAGGSYWWHYLVGLLPGLVLLASVPPRPGAPRSLLVAALAPVLAGTLVGTGWLVGHPARVPEDVAAASAYLRHHDRPGDTGVVLYGGAAVLDEAHLSSPYPYLWSLPVRVRDHDLTLLSTVLDSPHRPTWVVVPRHGAGTWGVAPSGARRVDAELARHYRSVEAQGGLRVLRARPPQAG